MARGNKKAHLNNPNGQPTKYREENLKLVKLLYNKGATDKEVCEALDICESTLTNWKKKIPDFKEQINDWKREADEKVERSLFERATGYSCKETKTFCHEGMIVAEDIIKHHPPDPTSMIFWLKNRRPDLWRDKSQVENVNPGMTLEEFIKLQSKEKK